MSAKDRKPYEDQAKTDKARYESEKEAYLAVRQPPIPILVLQANQIHRRAMMMRMRIRLEEVISFSSCWRYLPGELVAWTSQGHAVLSILENRSCLKRGWEWSWRRNSRLELQLFRAAFSSRDDSKAANVCLES